MTPDRWWASLDVHWQTWFESEHEITAKKAKNAAKITEVYLDESFKGSSLEPLLGLPKLKEFSCDSPKLRDLSPLKKLAKLESLRVSHVDSESLSGLKALQSLDLSGTSVDDLSFVTKMPGLRTLDISGTKVVDLAPLAKALKLESLNISDTKVSSIAALKSLRRFESLEAKNVKLDSWAPLAGLKKLREVIADGSNIDSVEFFNGSRLLIQRTSISLREALEFLQRAGFESSLWTDWSDSETLVRGLKALDAKGIEETLAKHVHNVLTSSLRAKEPNAAQILSLTRAWLAHSASKAQHAFEQELLSTIAAAVVRTAAPAELAKELKERLPSKVTHKVLAFNLACLGAARKDTASALEWMKVARSLGQPLEAFENDPDFASIRKTPEFAATLESVSAPTPATDPVGWWRSLSDDLRGRLSTWEAQMPTDLEDVTAADMERLFECELQLHAFNLKSLGFLTDFTALKSLGVEQLGTTDLSPISTLSSLVGLTLSARPGTRFDLAPLATLKTLETLNLQNLDADLRPVPMARMKSLTLWNGTFESLDVIGQGKAFERLSVGNFPSLELLAGCKRLSVVNVSLAKPGPVSLTPLLGNPLYNLSLDNGSLEDFTPLATFKSLRHLKLPKESVTKELKAFLKAKLPQCQLAK